jgi:hypothetical protein
MGALKDMGKIQQEMAETAAQLAEETFAGSGGAGMVVVKANGAMQIVGCAVDPQLVADGDRELIQELVVVAANEALAKAREHSAKVMQQKMQERFDLPGMEGLIGSMMPK